MLMNAAASGNRNYIAEISDLTTKYTDVNLKWNKCFREGRKGVVREEKMMAEITHLKSALQHLKEVCWCVIGSIQDEDDRQYLKTALKQEGE